jgi:hypothetical protein
MWTIVRSTEMPNGTVVSIQLVGMDSAPWEGHVTAGLLANRNTVLAPHPPEEILDAAVAYEVLVIPTPLTVDQPVERIRIAAVDANRLLDNGQLTSVTLELAYPSRYLPSIGAFDACRLGEEMAGHGDLWTALENVGAIEPGLRVEPKDLLHALPEIERAQRMAAIRTHQYRVAGDPIFNICRIIRLCQPCDPA